MVFRFLRPRTQQPHPDDRLIQQLVGALMTARPIVERESESERFHGGEIAWLTLKQIDIALEAAKARAQT